MPIAKIQLPDGRIAKIEVPEGATEQDVMAFVAANQSSFDSPSKVAQEPEQQPQQLQQEEEKPAFSQERYDMLLRANPQAAQAYFAQAAQAKTAKEERLQREQALNELAKTNPIQAEELRNMGPLKTGLIAAGGGFSDIISALPFTENKTDEERAIQDQLSLASPKGAAIGRALGQSAPFAGASVLANAPRLGIAGKSLIQGAIGATEGGLVAKGTGADQAGVLKGAAIGGALGAGGEVIGGAINRAARTLAKKVKGEEPSGRLIDDAGMPTAELNDVLEKSGKSFTELKEESAATSTEGLAESFARAGQSGRVSDVIDRVTPDEARIKAAQELGFDIENVPLGVLTKDQAAQELAGAMAAVPVSRASSAFDAFTDELSQRADNYIQEIGGTLDRAALGDDVLKSMQSDISRIKALEGRLYDDIRESIGEGTLINVKPVQNMLSARAKTRRGIKNLSPVERDVFNMVKDGKVTYANLDDKIRKIGAAIGKETDAYSTVELSKLNDMYSNLSRLRDGVARQFGKDDRLSRAKNLSVRRFGIQESTKNLFGKKLDRSMFPSIDQKTANLSTGMAKEFEAVMQNVPESYRGAVIATSINRALTGGKDAAQGLNATQFSRWFKNLKRNDKAYQALKKYAPEGSIRQLENLAEISEGVSGVKAGRIKTGIVSDTLKRFDDTAGLVDKLYSAGQKLDSTAVGSVAARPVVAAANVAKIFTRDKTPSSQAVDELLNSKEFKKAFISAAQQGTDSAKYKSQSAALKKTKAYQDYLKSIDSQTASAIVTTGLIPWLASDNNEEAN